MILLLLLNFTGSIGPTWGYYAPSLDSLNSWLYYRDERDTKGQLRTTSMVIGLTTRVEILEYLMVEAGADYYKGRSPDNARSLFLVPVEAYFTYKHTIFPVFLHTYIGVGAGLCFTEYEERGNKESGFALGPAVRTGIEFTPTPRLGIEVSAGWRFLEAKDINLIDTDSGNRIPIDLSGGYVRVTLERLLK